MARRYSKKSDALTHSLIAGSKPRRGIYKRKVSRQAVLSQLLGFLSLMLLVVSMVAVRFGYLTPHDYFWALGAVAVLCFFALAALFPATRDVLEDDALGAGSAVRGFFWAFLALAPFAYYGYAAIAYPKLNDISTDLETPPAFQALLVERANTPFPNGNLLEDGIDQQLESYPSIGPRRYSTSILRVAEAVQGVLKARGWRVKQSPPELEKKPAESADADGETKKDDTDQDEDVVQFEDGAFLTFEAVAQSLVLKLSSDVAIRITNLGGEARFDMRVANRHSAHDFGTSAALIENFLSDLDVSLLGVAGENQGG